MVVLNSVNNLPNFDFRGKNSLDMKLYMTSKPSIPSPEMRVDNLPVKGRDSTYTITDNTYDNIEITFGVRTYRGEVNYQSTLNDLNEWLRVGFDPTENEVTFSMFPQWDFIVKDVKPYTWLHNSLSGEMTAQITLVCDPYKYSDTYNEVVGITSTPVPMPPREYKFINSRVYRARNEQNYQARTDLAKYGYTRVLDDDHIVGVDKDRLSNIDDVVISGHQLKYTSGNYRNLIDDYYSNLVTMVAEEPDKVKFDVTNSFALSIESTSAKKLTITWETVEKLSAGVSYYFFPRANQIFTDMTLKAIDSTGKEVASSFRQTSLTFKPPTSDKYKMVMEFKYVKPTNEMGLINSPRLHRLSSDTKMAPARNSTFAGIVAAFDMRSLLDDLEEGLINDSMTEAQIKTALKARNLNSSLNSWNYHQSSSTFSVYQLNKNTGYDILESKTNVSKRDGQTFAVKGTTDFVDRLYCRKVGSRNEIWAIFLIESSNIFADDMTTLDGKYAHTDKISLSLGLDVKPQASKEIFNDGTAQAYPYLKVYPKAGASTCTVNFEGTDVRGRPYKEKIEIRNIIGITADQHIEVDCDLRDVMKIDRKTPSNSVSWNSWSMVAKFPAMQVGMNTISVDNADKVEIEWRTRRI